MRYLRYIAVFLALVAVSACAIDTLEPNVNLSGNEGDITVVGRITRFTDYDVATKAAKQGDEGKVTSIAMALYPIEGGAIGECDYFLYKESADLLFTIDRTQDYAQNTAYAMYVFANVPEMSRFANQRPSLDELKNIASEVSGVAIPENGFPMMGSLGDTVTDEKDEAVFILKPSSDGTVGLPTVDDVETDMLNIPMKAMFAKMNFTIKVTPDQVVEGKFPPQFTLSGYTVNNVPSDVDFKLGTNDDSDVVESVDGLAISGNSVASGASVVNFSFYVPERYLTPSTSSENYDYPFKNNGEIRGQDSTYMQRFKPLLPGEGQNATYVTLMGEYRDHQNHLYSVNYKIYLGKDNYGDFNIIRNSEYTNYITIRGIATSDDMSDNENAISIDHRVDIERMSPAIISLRRETLLDSHFEVRPLRIRPGVTVDGINAVKVEVVDPTVTDWIRIEHKNRGTEDATYCASGKRKYFTYNLVSGKSVDGSKEDLTGNSLKNSTNVVVPLTDTQCIWVYVDECTESADSVRSGIIRVTCGNLQNDVFTPVEAAVGDYVINQRYLYPVTYNGHTYDIEFHEEYLYNYDSEDEYGQTEYEGMAWGLDGEQLSHTHTAYFSNGAFASIENWLIQNSSTKVYYDFYLTRDIDETSAKRRDNAGYEFSSEIINYLPSYFTPMTLTESPDNAIEYCYNRNKRKADGSVASVNWYLPAIDEIENIMMGAYTEFLVFQDKLYWSSQPAFLRGRGHYYSRYITESYADYYFDDITSARATKIAYTSATGYNNISSGVDGYAQYMDIYKPINGMNNEPNIMDITTEPFSFVDERGNRQTINKMTDKTNHSGNILRTEKARIRCVYKAN